MPTVNLSFPDSSYSAANKPSITTLKDDLSALEAAINALTNDNVAALAAIAYSKLNLTGGIVNADVNAAAAIDISKTTLGTIGSSIITLLAPAWTEVLNLSGVSTTSDTDLDLTASTHASATHVILKVQITNTNTSEGSFLTLRAKGAAANEAARIILRANQVNGFHADYPFVVVPMDSEQRITYSINSNASATSVQMHVVGYYRALS